MTNPELIVFVGPMFSSKTSKLLMTLERFKYQGKKIVVFKPKLDDRYSTDQVVSHSGWKAPATIVDSGSQMLEVLENLDKIPDVVAVDEMFMLDRSAEVLVWLFKQGVTVVVATLDLSFSGQAFSEVEKLLPWATHVEKCSAVCMVCGRDAFYSHKKVDDDRNIQIGGAETYEPRCFEHAIFNKQLK